MGILVPIAPGGGGGPPSGPAGGNLGGNYPNPTVLEVNGVSVPAGPSLGQLLVALSGASSGWETPLPILASAYGVSPANPDNTAALNNAFAAGAGGTVILPPGVLQHSGALTATDCNIVGAGTVATTLECIAHLGAGIPALTFTSNPGWYPVLKDFAMIGPGVRTLGTKTAICDGIQITGAAAGSGYIVNVQVSQFDGGIVINNTSGHIFMRDLLLTNNYYGIYVKAQGGNFDLIDSILTGNSWASIGVVAGVGLSAWTMKQCHLGFGPYGIYEEALPAAQGAGKLFLYECVLQSVSFEQIGNAAIWSDATDTGVNYSTSAAIRITDPGFSWANGAPGSSALYTLPTKTANYAVKLGHSAYFLIFVDDATPFTAGATAPPIAAAAATAGIFFVNTAAHAYWARFDWGLAAAGDLTVGAGGGPANYFFGKNIPPQASSSLTVVAGVLAADVNPIHNAATQIMSLNLAVGTYLLSLCLCMIAGGSGGEVIAAAGTATCTFNGQASLAMNQLIETAGSAQSGTLVCECVVTVAGTVFMEGYCANNAGIAKALSQNTGLPATFMTALKVA